MSGAGAQLTFDRPVGAAADVKELEYISALHQTGEELRADASIKDIDIVHFLSSRYGIRATEEQVRTTILNGMGGGDDDCIDLMEMVAILFIPTLLKAAAARMEEDAIDGLVRPPNDLLAQVVNMILHDITGDMTPKLLTADLLKLIFHKYDERELASNDALIHDMVQVATQGNPRATFNPDTFARALTYDVQLYNYREENKVEQDDIFRTRDFEKQREKQMQEKQEQRARNRLEEGYDQRDAEDDAEKQHLQDEPVRKVKTFKSIDFIASSYQSKLLVLCLWTGFLINSFTYYFMIDVPTACPAFEDGSGGRNAAAFFCRLFQSVVIWLLRFILLSIYGLLSIGLGSVGNSKGVREAYRPLIGATAIGFFTVLPLLVNIFRGERALTSLDGNFLVFVSLAIGALGVFLHLLHAVKLLVPKLKGNAVLRTVSPSKNNGLVSDSRIRKAASHKVSGMADNALDVVTDFEQDNVVNSYFGQALLTFSKKGEYFEKTGGIGWTYRNILSGVLSWKEGVSYSSRFLASNLSQFVIAFLYIFAGVLGMQFIFNNFEEDADFTNSTIAFFRDLFDRIEDEQLEEATRLVEQAATEYVVGLTVFLAQSGVSYNCEAIKAFALREVETQCVEGIPFAAQCPFLQNSDAVCAIVTEAALNENNTGVDTEEIARQLIEEQDIFNGTGLDHNILTDQLSTTLGNVTAQQLNELYPEERYMVTIPFAIAAIAATVAAFFTALVYVPSITATVLKIRSGLIPSLTSKKFTGFRSNVEQVTLLSGSMFWGVFFSSALFGAILGLAIFLLLWQVTRLLLLRLLALVLGVGITLFVKWHFSKFRKSYWRAFFRSEPAKSNLLNVATESSNFAVSVFFVFTRMLKLVAVACLYVGRLDVFFLAPGVGKLAKFDFDSYPSIFLTDILLMEAHRHPYIDLLGVMYLMKLRHNEDFGKTAGSSWRLVFVTALMPWLQKYRILHRNEEVYLDDDGETIVFGDQEEEEFDEHTLAVVKVVQDEHGHEVTETVYVPPAPLRNNVSWAESNRDLGAYYSSFRRGTSTRTGTFGRGASTRTGTYQQPRYGRPPQDHLLNAYDEEDEVDSAAYGMDYIYRSTRSVSQGLPPREPAPGRLRNRHSLGLTGDSGLIQPDLPSRNGKRGA